jgi:hypothetical protein
MSWLIRPSFWRDDLIRVFRELADMTPECAAELNMKVLNGRTIPQNSKIQPMCRDIARQVKWSVNGEHRALTEQEWRHFFASHIRKGAKLVANIDGDGFVALGVGSSELSAKEASDMVELMYAFGATRGVAWSEPVVLEGQP